ncbi:MAG TPA: tryptophan--tRNA ligase, partial [Candidatus Paceibacterota bacterium]|nr:tryptophan--tRNA ligase [Candidatus Paceibacterota bacterium]
TDSKAPGDTKDPEKDNIFALHKLFSKEQLSDLEKRYKEGEISYKESKEILIENIKKIIKPLREKRKELEKDKEYVLDILREGGDEMRARAEKKMQEVRDKIGTKLYE